MLTLAAAVYKERTFIHSNLYIRGRWLEKNGAIDPSALNSSLSIV